MNTFYSICKEATVYGRDQTLWYCCLYRGNIGFRFMIEGIRHTHTSVVPLTISL
jgi:hypothetical protein